MALSFKMLILFIWFKIDTSLVSDQYFIFGGFDVLN